LLEAASPTPDHDEPLSLSDLIADGLLNELARVYSRQEDAARALAALGFPDERVPPFARPLDFWAEVCRLIGYGTPPGTLEALLRQAGSDFLHNEVFTPFR